MSLPGLLLGSIDWWTASVLSGHNLTVLKMASIFVPSILDFVFLVRALLSLCLARFIGGTNYTLLSVFMVPMSCGTFTLAWFSDLPM